MNIFYLDQDPKLCATYHADKHVVKMILESAQLLCTAVNVKTGKQVTPYKSTHVNHPCSVWVRESYGNFCWLYRHMHYLEEEWNFRYHQGNHQLHKSISNLRQADIISLAVQFYEVDLLSEEIPELTPPALAMPYHCKVSSSPVECYREYYRKEKVALHKWTGRGVPFWL